MNKKTDKVAAILRIMGNTYPEIASLMNMTENEASAAVWRGVYKADIENPEKPKPREETRVRELTYEDKPEHWLEVLVNWQTHFLRRNELVRNAKNAGVTVIHIAQALGVSRDTVYRWLEEGPDISFRKKVAVGCAVLHTDSEGNQLPCPGYPLCDNLHMQGIRVSVHNPAPESAEETLNKVHGLHWMNQFDVVSGNDFQLLLRHTNGRCTWGFVFPGDSLKQIRDKAWEHYGECDQ